MVDALDSKSSSARSVRSSRTGGTNGGRLSESTVKAHLAAAFKKLNVTNRVQAGLLIQSLSVDGSKIT